MVKYFIVYHTRGLFLAYPSLGDDQDFNITLRLGNAQHLCSGVGNKIKYLSLGKTLLAFLSDESIYLFAASDEDENYTVLRRQLSLIRDFIQFFYGEAKMESSSSSLSLLDNILPTITRLSLTSPSFLVQGVENLLFINKPMQRQCEDYLNTAINQSNGNILHGLLFVNGKLCAIASTNNNYMSSSDLFLISIYVESKVNPLKYKDEVTHNIDQTPSAEIDSHPTKPILPHNIKIYLHVSPYEIRLCKLGIDEVVFEKDDATLGIDENPPKIYLVLIVENPYEDMAPIMLKTKTYLKNDLETVKNILWIIDKRPASITPFEMKFHGLLYYILVDRTNIVDKTNIEYNKYSNFSYPNQSICSEIRSFDSRQRLFEFKDTSDLIDLKKIIREAIQNAQELQDAGYYETLRCSNGLQCHHKVWIEEKEKDNEGGAIDEIQKYNDILSQKPHHLKDNLILKRGWQAYELYAIYLPILSTQEVVKCSEDLVKDIIARNI